MHGKTSPIYHYGDGLFAGLPSPFDATRYHSLIVSEPLPDALEVTAFTTEGEVMGLRHKTLPDLRRPVPPRVDPDRARRTQILKNFLEPAGHQEGTSCCTTYIGKAARLPEPDRRRSARGDGDHHDRPGHRPPRSAAT